MSKKALQTAWDARQKLAAEASKLTAEARKLCAEASKLYAEASKLCAEGDLIWINAWIKVHGKESIVDWNWASV